MSFLSESKVRKIIRDIILNEIARSDGSLAGFLNVLNSYKDHTWIFFDTETTGLKPWARNSGKEGGPQLTQIAAIAVKPDWNPDGNGANILGSFNKKISFTEYTRQLMDPSSIERQEWNTQDQKRGKHALGDPRKLLSLTSYGVSRGKFDPEQDVINEFLGFISDYSNPLLVAQNASFDMRFLNVRSGGRMPKLPVLDTLTLIQQYLFPVLTAAASSSNPDPEALRLIGLLKNRERLSASLGNLSKAFDIEASGWHDALEDVKMLMSVYVRTIEILENQMSSDIDATKQIGAALSAAHKKERSR